MTTYRIWSGITTIGGNIVEVRTEKARVYCDFGLSVASDLPEDEQTQSELENLILIQAFPAIPELLETDDFEKLDLPGFHLNTLKTAVFISHLHLDHMGALKFLPKEVDVYLSEDSLKLYHLLLEVGEEEPVKCQLHAYKPNEKVVVGDITVEAQESDHDEKGAHALFIQTEDLKLIHSGDFRFNGYKPEKVKAWAEKARMWEPDVLLIEGTSYSFDDVESEQMELLDNEFVEEVEAPLTEEMLLDELTYLFRANETELLIYNPYIRNVERIVQVDKVAKDSGRTMVWEEAYAYVLAAFYPEKQFTVLEETFNGKLSDSALKELVSLDQLKEEPGKYVLQSSYKNIAFLEDFGIGIYIHSNGEPLGDYDLRYGLLLDSLDEYGFEFLSLGPSGHAGRDDIIEVAKTVSAKNTLPWHSFKPEALHKALTENGVQSFLPELGKEYRG